MPNWCYNNLKVEAEAAWTKDDKKHKEEQKKVEKELAKFKKENLKDRDDENDGTGGSRQLTFKGSVPMPKELEITSGSTTDQAISYLNAKNEDYSGIDKLIEYQWTPKECGFKKTDTIITKRTKIIKYLEKKITQKELKEGQQALDNIKKYGHKDWYNWSCDNWGTKWDTCEGGINRDHDSEIDLYFDTAWAPPIPWLAKVTKKYKRLKFTLEYKEEGMGFEGKTFAKNGELCDNNMNIEYPDTFWD